jgi:hypothetical protein
MEEPLRRDILAAFGSDYKSMPPPKLPRNPPSLAQRIRRIVCWTVIPFVVLVLGACPAENYRGHYLWNKYRKEWEAKGEEFNLM